MSMVTVRMPEAMLAERHRLGLDRRDEVWGGVYHLVPPPSMGHQRLGAKLIAVLVPAGNERGLEVVYEAGVIAPGVDDWSDFRVPDLLVARREHTSDRGVEGRAELVIEVQSPGDETFDKIAWYRRVGVQELLVIERDTRRVHHWDLQSPELRESEADGDGWVSCRALPFRLRAAPDATLEVDAGSGVVRIEPA